MVIGQQLVPVLAFLSMHPTNSVWLNHSSADNRQCYLLLSPHPRPLFNCLPHLTAKLVELLVICLHLQGLPSGPGANSDNHYHSLDWALHPPWISVPKSRNIGTEKNINWQIMGNCCHCCKLLAIDFKLHFSHRVHSESPCAQLATVDSLKSSFLGTKQLCIAVHEQLVKQASTPIHCTNLNSTKQCIIMTLPSWCLLFPTRITL